jgi:hypothetical protein
MNPSSDHEDNAGDQANVNNGKWTTAEHAIFLEGSSIPIQPSKGTEATG